MKQEEMQFVIERAVKCALEICDEAKRKTDSEFEQGRRMASYEIIDTIKNQLEVYEQNLNDYAIDFRVEDMLSDE